MKHFLKLMDIHQIIKNLAILNWKINTMNREKIEHVPGFQEKVFINFKKPNKLSNSHDYYFSLDGGNNWKMVFFDNDANLLEIRHRYFEKDKVTTFVVYFAMHMGGVVCND